MLLVVTVNTPMVLAILGILAAPIIGYLAAARKMSGKIGTSEATDLWEAQKNIVEGYREDKNTAAERVSALETRVAALEKDNNALARENIELLRKALASEQTIASLREELLESKKKELIDGR